MNNRRDIVSFKGGVTSIGETAFSRCTSLTGITIPDSVISIGESAFAYCRNLTTVNLLGDAPKIEANAFERSSPTIYREGLG